jgi:hypothetical protein
MRFYPFLTAECLAFMRRCLTGILEQPTVDEIFKLFLVLLFFLVRYLSVVFIALVG